MNEYLRSDRVHGKPVDPETESNIAALKSAITSLRRGGQAPFGHYVRTVEDPPLDLVQRLTNAARTSTPYTEAGFMAVTEHQEGVTYGEGGNPGLKMIVSGKPSHIAPYSGGNQHEGESIFSSGTSFDVTEEGDRYFLAQRESRCEGQEIVSSSKASG